MKDVLWVYYCLSRLSQIYCQGYHYEEIAANANLATLHAGFLPADCGRFLRDVALRADVDVWQTFGATSEELLRYQFARNVDKTGV